MPGPTRLFSFALLSLASLLGGCGPLQPARDGSNGAGGGQCPSTELPSHVVRFGPGMTPPVYVSGPQLTLTPEARAYGSSGTLRARCVVTAQGTVQNCILLESAPYMGEAYLEVLSQQRYRPTLLDDGTPVAVQFDFVLNVNAPPPSPAQLQAAPADKPLPGELARPVFVSGEKLKYPREALCNRVEGEMVVRCVITEKGNVEQCKVLKTVPYMEKMAVETLQSQRVTPVMFKGKPVRVNYVFNLKFVLPGRR